MTSPLPAVRVTCTDRVAVVTLERGDGLNRLDTEVMEALRDVALELQADAELVAVILHGHPVFSAGVDVATLAGDAADPQPTLAQIRQRLKLGPALCQAWESIEAFTIGAIEGYCVGGAAALAASLDHRILGRSAFLRLPEVPLGINLSWQAIPRLVAQIGPALTKQYVMFGRRIAAEQALAWGLCEDVVEDGQAVAAAQALADELRRLPPLSLRMTKQAINAAANALNHLASFMDRDQFLLATHSADFAEALAAFREKRSPRFTGN